MLAAAIAKPGRRQGRRSRWRRGCRRSAAASSRSGQKLSTARIGMLEPTKTCPGRAAWRAARARCGPRAAASTRVSPRSRRSPACRRDPLVAPRVARSTGGSASSSACGSHASTWLATWSWSRQARSGSIRKVGADAAASHALSTRRGGRSAEADDQVGAVLQRPSGSEQGLVRLDGGARLGAPQLRAWLREHGQPEPAQRRCEPVAVPHLARRRPEAAATAAARTPAS